MNKRFLKMLGVVSIALTTITTNLYAKEHNMTHEKASFIEMKAATGETNNFVQFLTGAAPLVKSTEPRTLLWFALQSEQSQNQLAIFDIFSDESARDTHFAGAVAGALEQNASTLVKGGWNQGVVANINNSSVLSTKEPVDLYRATKATYISITAADGKEDDLAELLNAAGAIVTETEPKTLYWVALKLDKNNFAIFDIFADNAGRKAHFAGTVASLLKEKSPELVQGGWDHGVVANIKNFNILAIK